MIKNIIFDIGFVLINFDFVPYVKSKFDEKACEALCNYMWGSEYWHDFDMGYMSTQEVIDRFAAAVPGFEKEMREALRDFGENMTLRDFVIPWITELKELGYKVYFLSNWSEFLMNAKPGIMDFTKLCDGGIFSCDVHMVKPDPEIYKLLMKKYNLIPDECIFIDDMDRNIEAANVLGINGIVYEGYELTRQNVEKIIKERE